MSFKFHFLTLSTPNLLKNDLNMEEHAIPGNDNQND